MRTLPAWRATLPDLASGPIAIGRLLTRIAGTRDVPEPVAAWRAVSEETLRALNIAAKSAFIGALLPLARPGRKVARPALRRLYQLFAFFEMPEDERQVLIGALHTRQRLAPDPLPHFGATAVRRTLLIEALGIADAGLRAKPRNTWRGSPPISSSSPVRSGAGRSSSSI